MRNIFTVLFRKTLIPCLMLLLLASSAMAQTDISIGTGTAGNGNSSYPAPLQDYWEGSRAQYLFRASELTAAGMGPGMISAVKFNVVALNSMEIIEQYSIKIATTSLNSLTTTGWENTGAARYGPVDYTPAMGINAFPFTGGSFFWNGTDNIIVEVCNGGDDWSGNATVPWTTGLPFNASRGYAQDGQGSLCGYTGTTTNGTASTRPNIIFTWQAAAPCTGTPNGGTAVSNMGSVCLGGTFSLNLTGATVASGLSYQWQSSANNSTWTNIPGATTASYTGTQAASTYYRCIVTCTNGGGSAPSASVQVSSPTLVYGVFSINKGAPTDPVVARNFNSFNDAYNYIKCGISNAVVFNVLAGSGIYNEQLVMAPVPGASATNTVTFNGNGQTISYKATNGSERATIKLDGADHIIFNNLVIEATGSTSSEYGYGVQLMNDADSNIVNNCTINVNTTSTSTNFAGIVVSSSATSATNSGDAKCDANVFSGNNITGGYYGITLVGSDNFANGSNKILNNQVKEFYTYGLYLSYTFNTSITGNTISRPTRTTVDDFYGVYLTQLNTKDSIYRNRITDPFGGSLTNTNDFYGVYFTGVDALVSLENIVANNLIYNITGAGAAYAFYNSSSDNVYYYHNTIALDGGTTSASYATRGLYITTSQVDGVAFVNNIVAITRTGPGPKHALYIGTTTSSIISDRNVLFIAPNAGNAFIGYYTANQPTLSNWQTATGGYDTTSLTSNPMFTSTSTGNYSPVNASIDNRGIAAGYPIDINSAPRSATTPDIGAYEFTPPPCTVPPTPGTATVALSPVCVNVRVPFSLTGNTVGLTQTYQWQVSSTAAGPYTNLGSPLTNPDTIITATVTSWYRVAVTCSGNTAYSTPVQLTVTQALPGDTYTIDKNAAPGTPKTYLSFNAAKAALECGIAGPVIFDVKTGGTPYLEQLILDSIPGASAVNTITFRGNGNTIKFSSTDTDERAVIKLRRTDHVTFDSLVIDATGTGDYGFGVQLINNADSNTIRKCRILTSTTETYTEYAGIVVNASESSATTSGATLCDGNTFDRNIIIGGYYGVTLYGDDDKMLKNNRVTNNDIREFYSTGISISYSANGLVEGNTISRPTRTNSSYTVTGISVYYESNKLVVSRNTITNPFGGEPNSTNDFYGIYVQYANAEEGQENLIVNNLLYNINGKSYQYGITNYYADNNYYYHNTVSLDDQSYTGTDYTRAYYVEGEVAGIRIFNNIGTVTRSGTGRKHGIYIGNTNSDVTSDYNDFYVSGTQSFFGYYGADIATLQTWQTTAFQDANSLSTDPIYADLAGGNLSPVISPLDNTGTPLNVPIDIRGITRSTTTPDIGAFEISIPPCVAPPVAGTAVANPASNVCLGANIALTLNGNTSGGGQVYQWFAGKTAAGPWRAISETRYVKEFKTELTMDNYFRCMVICGGTDTAYSTPAFVNMNAPLPSGFYTINPAAPVGNRNYQSFTQAVAALECGIAGWVTFNVFPGTYTEQVRMHRVYGASDTSRITFQSRDHAAASVTLAFTNTSAANYVLKLDSASYVTYKEITIKSNGTSNGRVVELANTASADSLLNNIINAPVSTSSTANVVGIYADDLKGVDNVIKGNTVNNGSSGINISGTATDNLLPRLVIDSNTVSGSYQYNIYTYYTTRIRISRNTLQVNGPRSTTTYGLYAGYSDTAYQVIGNTVNIRNTTGTVYGIYVYYSDATQLLPGRIANNRIKAFTGNTGSLYGLSNYYSSYNDVVNNVISIKTSGSTAYGLYSYQDEFTNYYNNSVLSTATSATNNAAAYFNPDGFVKLRNNIFSHQAGGNALFAYDPDVLNSDYNTFYTTGTNLVRRGTPAESYANLQLWRDTSNLDLSSIVYKPAFENDSTLEPAVNIPDVWAIHGRGVQVPGNDRDIRDSIRPTTLIAGVPDMGAYEFLPAVIPPALPATPAQPAPGITQTFMFGTDTVTKITWGPAAPDTVAVRRYSGVIPPNVDQSKEFMYFYTDVDASAPASGFSVQQYFVDSWQGSFQKQTDIRLGRTDASNAWKVNDSSRIDDIENIIADTSLPNLDKYTGLKGNMVTPPITLQPADSSNRGTKFWVGYGHHQFFDPNYGSYNEQGMVLYLSTEDSANVTVRINGTSYVKRYHIPANTVITSEEMPKTGLFDARLLQEGASERGISIESDIPIVAYAHIYGNTSSGATMLLPVGTYGYEYYTLSTKQSYSTNTYSWFYVVAAYDNTQVEIIPSQRTLAGRPAEVPFTVTLNRGEVYQVLGALLSENSSQGFDLTGSRVRSVQNSAGKCYPIAVFSGSSRTSINCDGGTGGNGDNIIQQNFPSQAWGKRYLTAPTSIDVDPSSLMTNIYRVLVKDTATKVTRNGQLLTNLINKRYYQFESDSADRIEADQPVMVAQYMASYSGCPNTLSDGDPEMIYLSPLEQGIKKMGLYRNTEEGIVVNYLTVIIPTAGVPTLLIDGTNSFDFVYQHHNMPGYTVVVKRWDADKAQCIVTSDSAFTAITYGEGSAESYGYNAGTLVKNLNALPSFNNIYNGSGQANKYTCAKTPFRFSMLISVKPTILTWKFSEVSNLTSNLDVTQANPVPVDSVEVNGRKYFEFTVDSNYVFSAPGTYYVPIVMTHPDIESCGNSLETILPVTVIPAPVVDFDVSYSGCIGDTARFNGIVTTANGVGVDQWKWNFADSDTSIIQNPAKKFNAAGVYNVKLSIIAEEGCIGDTTIPVTVNAAPQVSLVKDSLMVCAGSDATFEVQNPDPDVTYNWYDAVTGGTVLGSGSSFTIPGITNTSSYYVEAVKAGCAGEARTKAVVTVFPLLVTPIAEVDSVGVNLIRFKWAAVPNATGYEVSIDDGDTWNIPSSGETGLTHTVTGLQPVQSVTLIVKAKGCQDKLSAPVTGKTLPDGVFIPNAFSPNGDGLNDVLKVYGYIIKSVHFMIFNQWGEKVFETNTQSKGWDGMYKGKEQPSGVYIYVCRLQLTDGTVVDKKGAINLIR